MSCPKETGFARGKMSVSCLVFFLFSHKFCYLKYQAGIGSKAVDVLSSAEIRLHKSHSAELICQNMQIYLRFNRYTRSFWTISSHLILTKEQLPSYNDTLVRFKVFPPGILNTFHFLKTVLFHDCHLLLRYTLINHYAHRRSEISTYSTRDLAFNEVRVRINFD